MKKTGTLLASACAVALATSGAAVAPAFADVMPSGGAIVISAGTNFQEVRIAHNTSNGDSLVLYNKYDDDHFTQLIGPDGTPKGTPVKVLTAYFSPNPSQAEDVIYNPQANNYMVLTAQSILSGPSTLRSEVQVQIVNADGSLGARKVAINWPEYGTQPEISDMAYDSVHNQFMVMAWGSIPVDGYGSGTLYRQVIINAAGDAISPVRTGSLGKVTHPQYITDVHALEFDPVSATYLSAHTEYSVDGDLDKLNGDNWIETEQFAADGTRLQERQITPTSANAYTHISLAPNPNGSYLLSYLDNSAGADGTPAGTQYTQPLSADGSAVGPRHPIDAKLSYNGIEAGAKYDSSTRGYVLFRGELPPVQLAADGTPTCAPLAAVVKDLDALEVAPGRFIAAGRKGGSNDIAVQFYETNSTLPSAFQPAAAPFRVFDSRADQPAPGPKGTVGPNGSVKIAVRGVGPVPNSASVSAVVVNLTVVGTQAGFASAYPSGSLAAGTQPTFSNLNITTAGQVRPNMAIVPVGADGKIEVYTQGASDVLVDVTGWFEQAPCHATGGRFLPLPVSRVFDSRAGETAPGPKGHIGAGQKVTVQISGKGGVPSASSVGAVALAVVATNTDGTGFVTVAPTIADTPTTSLINVVAGETAPNALITPLSAKGTVDVYVQSGADIAIDVSGYFTNDKAADASAGLYVPIQPARIFDARPDAPDPGPKGKKNGEVVTVTAAGVGGLPTSGVAAIALNVGGLSDAGAGYVSAWNGTDAQPLTSVLNFAPNDVRAAAALTPVSATGSFSLYTSNAAFLFADAAGYFTAAPATK